MVVKLIDFYSSTCGPCRMLLKSIDKVVADHPEIVVEKYDENCSNQLIEKYNVGGVPTLIIEKDGVETFRFERAVPPQEIEKYI